MFQRSKVAVAFALPPLLVAMGGAAAGGKEFTDDEVSAAAKAAIAERSKDGVLQFDDARSGDRLELVPEDVRIVRGLKGFGWFPNVAFHDKAEPKKKYTLDLWLKLEGEDLRLVDVRVHKVPRADGAGWMSVTRPPLAWWWLPTIERASAVAAMPAWKVMGSIHAQLAKDAKGTIPIAVAAGEGLPSLQFVDVEQPVGRSKTDGRYFACALLRKFGSEAGFYSTTYWLDGKTNLVTAGTATAVDADHTGGTKAATEPRCDVGGIAFDVID